MKPRRCSVVISAYKAERWILECLESIRRQKVALGWEYNVLIGVDGCESTSRFLSNKGYTHYYSPINVGPYIIRNSLFALSKASAYAVFDADDYMTDSYLHSMLNIMGDGIAGSARYIIDEEGHKKNGRNRYRCGICTISASAMAKLGGYLGHRIAADHDLIQRAKYLGIRVHKSSASLYYRRIHNTSLTQAQDTGMKSEARRACVLAAKELRDKGQLRVIPVTTPLIHKPGFYK